ncbi:hypothetical protein ABW19_dt0202384 [Dactylella cylindrospora]|nr:hypothetical protein ABW19_dt0202384 [Dactylella cylindrospora]
MANEVEQLAKYLEARTVCGEGQNSKLWSHTWPRSLFRFLFFFFLFSLKLCAFHACTTSGIQFSASLYHFFSLLHARLRSLHTSSSNIINRRGRPPSHPKSIPHRIHTQLLRLGVHSEIAVYPKEDFIEQERAEQKFYGNSHALYVIEL